LNNFVKNQIMEIDIDNLSSQAHGVGHINGFTFFIKGALPGERIKFKVIKLYKSYGIGAIVNILKQSPGRITPKCAVYPRCGGCALLHCDYSTQLLLKTDRVSDALRVIGKYKLSETRIAPCVGMEYPYRYRNKAKLPIGAVETKARFGFYTEHSHYFVPIDDCLLCPREFGVISQLVSEFINENNIPIYNEDLHTGIVRHLIIRQSASAGETIITLSINAEHLPRIPALIKKLGSYVSGVSVNINMDKTNVILGDETICVWGNPYITDELCGIKYKASVNSFLQVNHAQTAILYQKAVAYAKCENNALALDIFCGIGIISLLLARDFKKVYGVEIVKDAVLDARINAEKNGVDNVEFIQSDAADAITAFINKGIKPDCIVVDPPRKGLEHKLIDAMLVIAPEKIVYISCDPATLSRDIGLLEAGYLLSDLNIFDCFPQTFHIESIAVLQRR